MARWRPFVQGDSYMANKKWTPLVIGNGYTTTDGASGPAPEYETVTGNPVSFNALTPFPLRQLSVAFSPVQSGTGDPSPTNVRPILGWDSLNVYHSGADTSNPQTISISLGSTVYGGTVDVVTGVVTVTHLCVTLNTLTKYGTLINGTVTAAQAYSLPSLSTTAVYSAKHGAISSTGIETFAYFGSNRTGEALPAGCGDGTFAISADGLVVRVYDTDKTITSANFDAKYGATQVWYPLNTPQTIQLTPQEVESLAGDNVLFSDANGDLTVTYRSN